MPTNLLSSLRLLAVTNPMTLRKPFLFPSLKLKHAPFLASRAAFPSLFTVRTLSSFRNGRMRFLSPRSEIPRSSRGRLGDRPEVRVSHKSLVEDEAELSDWVGELRTSSYRGKLTNDEDDDGGGGGGGRDRRNKISYESTRRRRRDSDSEESVHWRNRRDSVRRRFEGEYKEEDERRFSSRRVGDNNKGRSLKFEEDERRRFGNRSDYNNKGRNVSFPNPMEEKGRARFDSARKSVAFSDEYNDDDLLREEEEEEEEEEEVDREKLMWGIDGLLTEDESNVDDESDEEEILRKSKSSLFGEDKGHSVGVESVEKVVRTSSNSYLSETR